MSYTTLEKVKKHLNIESDNTDDDTYIGDLILIADSAIDEYTKGGLKDLEEVPVTVQHAATLLSAHLYLNRNLVSFAQGYELPYSYKFLLNPYMNFSTDD